MKKNKNLFNPMALLVAAGLLLCVPGKLSNAAVTLTEGAWEGDIRNGEKCILLENPRLKLTILRKGAYIISVVDKRTGQDFINNSRENKSEQHGIYDRVNNKADHFSNINDPNHVVNREYPMEQIAPGSLRFTCQTDCLRIVRTVTLDPELPKMKILVTYTWLSEETTKTGIFLLTQVNLNRAPVSYNQAVVMPRDNTIERVATNDQGFGVENPKAGWWFAADRDSKKVIVLTYPTDGSVAETYLYRVANWIHLLPFTPNKVFGKDDSQSLWQEYLFLSGPKDVEALSSDQVSVTPEEFNRLKAALLEELATDPVKPGAPRKVSLPAISPENRIEPPLEGKPEATAVVFRNAIYDHPTKLDRQTWVSLERAFQTVAEIKGSSADLLVVAGASCNALESEFRLTKEAVALSGLSVVYIPNSLDAKQTGLFEKELGPKNWVRKIKDVTFIGFAPGETEWLKATISQAAEGRIIVIGEDVPAELAQKTKVNLALLRQNTSMPSFARIGNWPVLYVPPVQDYGRVGFAVINIFPDYLDVLIKPLCRSFGPRLYLDKEGKSPTLGIPPFVKGKRILKVAHIADTQLNLPSRTTTSDGKPLDQDNMRRAIAEINALDVDFAVNAGDLVNVGSSEEQWKLYNQLKEPLKAPIYEVLGNHDWDKSTPEGEYVTASYGKFCDDPLIYDFEKKDVLFVAFGTAVTKTEDLLKRLPQAGKAKCTVLLYHDPINTGGGYTWWTPELYEAAHKLSPTIVMAGHTHGLQWNRNRDLNEFVSSSLGWTKTGDPAWNGYFVHIFFKDKVVSSYKRLGCDDLFFTVVTPYRK